MEEEKAKAAAAAARGDSPQGGGDTSDTPPEQQPISPEAMLEEMSLQQSMDKNKESLKRKLMMRRSVTELVEQGIYPPLKTPPAFAEQRKHLERAKTGDLLRHKIIHRPDRQLLVQQHILEDTKIDPSLHERQRLLKRARLADDLNEKLLHRPGPLDLIRGNILKTEDEMLTDAITDGVVQLQVPDNKDSKSFHFVFDDDSSEGAPSPSQTEESGMSDIGSPPVVPPAPDPPPLQLKTRQTTITAPTFTKMSPLNTQSIAVLSTPITSFSGSLSSSSSSKNGNSGNGINKASRQKKSKPKTSSKSKVIKFHEYKGPPSASKSQVTSTVTSTASPSQSTISSTPPAPDTKYHLMLQQQQLFLQWQLEFQQKNLSVPVTLLPQQKVESSTAVSPGQSVAGSVIMTSAINSPPTFASSPPTVVQAQGVVPAQGLLPPQNVVPAQGMLATPSVVPAQGMVPSQVATTVVSTSLLQSSTVPHTVIKQQPAQLQTVSQPQVQKVQQVQVQSGQSVVQKPGSQVRTHTHPVSQTHHSKSQNKSNHIVQKPFANLEDMKVADLKQELKKRNLPVSGPKPQLIERLKPYVDVIIGVAQGSVNTSVANDNSSLIKKPVQTIVSVKSVPLTPLDEAVCMQSPPCSPKTEQTITTTPLSPEIMDIAQSALNAQNKGGPLTLSQSSIPMAVDNSRPPSVAPMDITMDVDGPMDIRRFSPTNVSQAVTPPVTSTVTSPKPQSQPQLQTQPAPPVKQANSPPGAAPQISSEILLQQQRRIAQLQKELEESQMRLKLQQMQHQHLQQQQRHLQQQQTTHLAQQPASPPQLSQQPNSPPQQVIQQIIQQPTSPPQFMQPSPQPTPPPQILHAMTSQPNSPPVILQQPLSPPQSVQQPISPPQLVQQPISSPQQPLSPQQMLATVTLGDGKISPIPQSVGMTKLVQIPTQSLHSMIGNPPVLTTTHGLQLAHHGIPTVMVATSAASDNKKQGAKPNLTDFFKTQSLHQSLNLVKPGTSSSAAMFKQPTLLVTSGAKTITLTAPLNGLATTRTTSLPSSPVEAKMSLGRTMSNPFFVPQKEPPKYDEAVRNKHNSQQGTGASEISNGTVPNKIPVKSQAMDDVLEILIRTGELPPSAAQEPPPTPKTTTQTATIPTTVSQSSVAMTTTTTTTTVVSYSVTSSEQYAGLSSTFTATAPSDSAAESISTLLNSPQQVSSLCVKQESSTPPPLMVTNVLSPDTSSHDLLDINDYMLNQDLNSMDWTSDQSFTLDLNDTSSMHMQTDQEMKCDGVNDFLNVPLLQGGNNKGAPHGSEPDLTGLGLSESDNSPNNHMDVSDWLDVIMPSTGLTPLSANPPASFPSDPILTPKTQQEVLELFNFDDTDFNTPTDLQSGINWEKLTETTGSS